jgi:hypothetical protein
MLDLEDMERELICFEEILKENKGSHKIGSMDFELIVLVSLMMLKMQHHLELLL